MKTVAARRGLLVLVFVALAGIFGPAVTPRADPNATIQRAQHRPSQIIVFKGQSSTSMTVSPGDTVELSGVWEVDGQDVFITRKVTTAGHGSYFVEIFLMLDGVELLDVPSARFVVNAP